MNRSTIISALAGAIIGIGILVLVVPNIIAHRSGTALRATAATASDPAPAVSEDQARYQGAPPGANEEVSAGMMAPNFKLNNLAGKPVSLRSLRGKVVFLNVWATWCEPCRMEMPSIEKLYNEFRKNKGIVVLAVSEDDGPASTVASYLEKGGYNFPVLLDPKNRLTDLYNLSGVPETFIIDRKGRIVAHHMGAFDWSRPDVKEALQELIDAKAG